MTMIDLANIDPGQRDLVGGKAAGLAQLISLAERVPAGFCLTTKAYQQREVPTHAVLAAYEELGGGRVAVRSSATTEDLPGASFAGQHESFLDISGSEALLAAIQSCWDSLHQERALAYRQANAIDPAAVQMAVVVQRMVPARAAGVLFTANPVSGSRRETVIDAAPGLGTAVVDGAGVADHYVLDGSPRPDDPAERGCLSRAQQDELREAGARVQRALGGPRDIEWAYDAQNTLWLLQARPITSLFPAPPESSGIRLYVELGHVQGMLQPATPMGMATLRKVVADMLAGVGMSVPIVDIGGRLYCDLTDAIRDPSTRRRLVKLMAVDFGPRAQAVVAHLLDDPRFAPARRARSHRASFAVGPKALVGIVDALVRPTRARERVFAEIERRRHEAVRDPSSATALLDLLEAEESGPGIDPVMWPVVSGILVSAALSPALKGIATETEVHTVLGGMPHNVTIEMDFALWDVAKDAAPHRELLLSTSPGELAAAYRAGSLPDIGLGRFLDAYGVRSTAEVDVGVPRWEEDPTPVFAVLANYLRVSNPVHAPDRRFEEAAARAEAMVAELTERARRRPVRGRLAVLLLGRVRELAGLREAGKFVGLFPLRDRRRRLLLIGATLVERNLLDHDGDVMFLTPPEVRDAVERGADHRRIVIERQATHHRELRRRRIPVALLSDGTDAETLIPAASSDAPTLVGTGASTGTVSGPARVVFDPATATIEPGDILVTTTTDPGWTPLFLSAGGLVCETGAVMAHGPTVAREFGIPAVIGVPDATRRIRNGQNLTVDGAAGTVALDPAVPTAHIPAPGGYPAAHG